MKILESTNSGAVQGNRDTVDGDLTGLGRLSGYRGKQNSFQPGEFGNGGAVHRNKVVSKPSTLRF